MKKRKDLSRISEIIAIVLLGTMALWATTCDSGPITGNAITPGSLVYSHFSITSPSGDAWHVGQKYNITWDNNTYPGSVNIYYRTLKPSINVQYYQCPDVGVWADGGIHGGSYCGNANAVGATVNILNAKFPLCRVDLRDSCDGRVQASSSCSYRCCDYSGNDKGTIYGPYGGTCTSVTCDGNAASPVCKLFCQDYPTDSFCSDQLLALNVPAKNKALEWNIVYSQSLRDYIVKMNCTAGSYGIPCQTVSTDPADQRRCYVIQEATKACNNTYSQSPVFPIDNMCTYPGPIEDCMSCVYGAPNPAGGFYIQPVPSADYSKCYFSNGTCFSGVCDNQPPHFMNNGAEVINISNGTAPINFNFSFADNVDLEGFDLKICKGTECISKSFALNGTRMDWTTLPQDVLDWVDAKAGVYSTFNVSIKAYDTADLSNEDSNFLIIVGEDVPQVSQPYVPFLKTLGQSITIESSVIERLSGIKSFSIYVDNTLVFSCTGKNCSYTYIPSEGKHSYNVTALDNAGNVASRSGDFTILGTKNVSTIYCSETGGRICAGGEICLNDQYINTSDTQKCCTTSCYSSESNLTCSTQNGTLYSLFEKDCTLEIPAADAIDPNRCCATFPTTKTTAIAEDRTVHWEDSVGNHVSGVGVQENVKCVATGTVESIQILKDEASLSESVGNSIQINADQLGDYVCRVVYKDGIEKSDSLKVIEVPSPSNTTELPGFGILQFFMASVFIFAYYLKNGKRKQ